MHPNQKDFFDFIYRDNADRIVNIRDRAKDELQWQKNIALQSKELELQAEYGDQSAHAIYFIVGAPRTGSTLLSQILINAFQLGCQLNKVAKYYMAPLYGYSNITLPKDGKGLSLNSTLGNTDGGMNAHEFGFFWQYWLNYEDDHQPSEDHLRRINVKGLQAKLNAISNFFGADILIKNQVYVNFIIEWIASNIKNSKFIFIRRDLSNSVESILNSRMQQYGNYEYWWSLQPRNYSQWMKLHPIEQVCHQVCYTNDKIKEQLSSIDDSRQITINYSELSENLSNTLMSMDSFFGKDPTSLEKIQSQISVRTKDYNLPWSKEQVIESVRKVKEIYN